MTDERMQQTDGYHTFAELYEHRYLLFIALLATSQGSRGWWSKLHADGTMFDDSIIAGIRLPTGMITYHLPERYSKMLTEQGVKERQHAPEWDGHTSADVITRLTGWLA